VLAIRSLRRRNKTQDSLYYNMCIGCRAVSRTLRRHLVLYGKPLQSYIAKRAIVNQGTDVEHTTVGLSNEGGRRRAQQQLRPWPFGVFVERNETGLLIHYDTCGASFPCCAVRTHTVGTWQLLTCGKETLRSYRATRTTSSNIASEINCHMSSLRGPGHPESYSLWPP